MVLLVPTYTAQRHLSKGNHNSFPSGGSLVMPASCTEFSICANIALYMCAIKFI